MPTTRIEAGMLRIDQPATPGAELPSVGGDPAPAGQYPTWAA